MNMYKYILLEYIKHFIVLTTLIPSAFLFEKTQRLCLRPQWQARGGDVNVQEVGNGGDGAAGRYNGGGGDQRTGHKGGAHGVGDVLSPASNGTLASDLGLHDAANKRKHCKATVLDFLQLHRVDVTLGEAEGIENSTGVADFVIGKLVAGEQRVSVPH